MKIRTYSEYVAKTGCWIAALAGLWILVSPFILGGAIGTGTVMWSNVVAGGIALILAAYVGYYIHSSE